MSGWRARRTSWDTRQQRFSRHGRNMAGAGPGERQRLWAGGRARAPSRTRRERLGGGATAEAEPGRAGSACRAGPLGLRRASWPCLCPAIRPVSKGLPRHCGCDGKGVGASAPPRRPRSGPSRRPAAPPERPGCPSVRSRRRVEAAAARQGPEGTPSPAWTTGHRPPPSLPRARPAASRRRRARF